jgi:hypothetical protein
VNEKKLVPDDFIVPVSVLGNDFKVRMLTIHDLVKDYDAVMSSIDHLQGIFGPDHDWPYQSLSLEQNLIDLGWHQKEFQRRTSFTYTVLSLDETQCLGCVYIFPYADLDQVAEVYMWVRKSEAETGLEEKLFQFIDAWLTQDWPFIRVVYPYRNSR